MSIVKLRKSRKTCCLCGNPGKYLYEAAYAACGGCCATVQDALLARYDGMVPLSFTPVGGTA